MRAVVLDEHLALVDGRHGRFLVNRHDVYIGRSLELYGEFSDIEVQFYLQLLRPGDGVVEVGANIGSHTVPIARRVGPQGRVIAVEPQPACYALLEAQVALNRLWNVTAHRCGAGALAGIAHLPRLDYDARNNFGGIALADTAAENTIPVRIETLDSLVGDGPIRLIKIDVEGMEADVLAGAAGVIDRDRPRLYVENDRSQKSRPLVERLLVMGYRLWWHFPPMFNPKNHFGAAENAFGSIVSFNMLCLHRTDPLRVEGLREILSADEEHPLARRQQQHQAGAHEQEGAA